MARTMTAVQDPTNTVRPVTVTTFDDNGNVVTYSKLNTTEAMLLAMDLIASVLPPDQTPGIYTRDQVLDYLRKRLR